MKKLILTMALLTAGLFAQEDHSSDMLWTYKGSDFEDAGGNLYALGGVGLYESGGMALKISPPAPFTLTQTGAEVQAILNGQFSATTVPGSGTVQSTTLSYTGSDASVVNNSSIITIPSTCTFGFIYSLDNVISIQGQPTGIWAYSWIVANNAKIYLESASLALTSANNVANVYGMYSELSPEAGSSTTIDNYFGVYSNINKYGAGTLTITDYCGFYSDLEIHGNTTLTNGFHFYGIGAYPSWFGGSVNSSAGYNYSADTSSTDAYKMVLAGAHTLIAGLEVTFKAVTANTDGATLQVNSLTAKALTKANTGAINTALVTNDILAGQIVKAVYDGTQFQVISPLNPVVRTAALSTTHTLSADSCYGMVLYVTAAVTITLPAIAAGMSVTFITIGANAVVIEPGSGEQMYLDGTLLDADDSATNTSTAGDLITFTYYGAGDWYAASNGWTDND